MGGALGALVGGPIGAVAGAALGHGVDVGVDALVAQTKTDYQAADTIYFVALFSTLGHVAKSDGRVSEAEIAVVENMMKRLRLNNDQRRQAIRLFEDGKRADFRLEAALELFGREARRHPALVRNFLSALVDVAIADGAMHERERGKIMRAATALGVSAEQYEQLEQLRGVSHARAGSRGVVLGDPYLVLGVNRTAPDAEVKQAYRRLMSRHHPDKLASRGLPEDALSRAKERVREIRAAYDQIRKERGIK